MALVHLARFCVLLESLVSKTDLLYASSLNLLLTEIIWFHVHCEDTAGKCQCEIRDITHRLEVANSLNHGGRFEWIDSVLVRCLQDGDWLLIDNVNFCRFVFKSQLFSVYFYCS